MFFFAVIFVIKVDMAVKQEQEERAIPEEASLNQLAIIALMVAVACFAVGEETRSLYFSLMLPSHPETLISVIPKSETFGLFAPILLLPLFGSFADKKEGRRTGVFSSFILLFVGSTFFYLSSTSDSVLIPLAASTLFQVGSYLFEVSFWALLGYFTPNKVLGVILGIAFSLKEFAPRFFGPFMASIENWLGFAVAFFLVIGIKCVLYALREFKGKEEESKVNNDDMIQMVVSETA